tara:strand:- start:4094 stop:4717 length:624 start_codon:yes stop_codon:yes gene_type:complete
MKNSNKGMSNYCISETRTLFGDFEKILDQAKADSKKLAPLKLILEYDSIIDKSDKSKIQIIEKLYLSEFHDSNDLNKIHFKGQDLGEIVYTIYNKNQDILSQTESNTQIVSRYRNKDLLLTDLDQIIRIWNKIMNISKQFESIEPKDFYPHVSIRNMDYFSSLSKITVYSNGLFTFSRPISDLGFTYHSDVSFCQELRDKGLEPHFK